MIEELPPDSSVKFLLASNDEQVFMSEMFGGTEFCASVGWIVGLVLLMLEAFVVVVVVVANKGDLLDEFPWIVMTPSELANEASLILWRL